MTAACFLRKTQTSAVGRELGPDLPPSQTRAETPAETPAEWQARARRPPAFGVPVGPSMWAVAPAARPWFSVSLLPLCSALRSSWRGPKAKGRTGSGMEVPQGGARPGEGDPEGGGTLGSSAPKGKRRPRPFARGRSHAVVFDKVKEAFFTSVGRLVSVIYSGCGCRFYFPVAWENVILANALYTFHQTKYSQKFRQMNRFFFVN